MRYSAVIIILALLSAFGCSNSNIVEPETAVVNRVESISSHSLWGLWQFRADPEAGKLDVVPLRMGEMHLNALPFLTKLLPNGYWE